MADADMPVTLGMLELAIEDCSQAFGEALHTALVGTGANSGQIKAIAQHLTTHSERSASAQIKPIDLCRTAILTGLLKSYAR